LAGNVIAEGNLVSWFFRLFPRRLNTEFARAVQSSEMQPVWKKVVKASGARLE
jgi:hypothetical protein